MKTYKKDGYTVSWNANFYEKDFDSLNEAVEFAKKVDGIVLQRLFHTRLGKYATGQRVN